MKKHLYKWVYIALAAIVMMVIIFFAKTKIETPKIDMSLFSNDGKFSAIHYNRFKVDSFKTLAQKAYAGLISISEKGDLLEMTLDNTNQLASDYYNNNDALLQFNLKNNPFEIKLDEQTRTVTASYKIIDKAVTVPNDVIMKMMYKTYNK